MTRPINWIVDNFRIPGKFILRLESKSKMLNFQFYQLAEHFLIPFWSHVNYCVPGVAILKVTSFVTIVCLKE